MLYKSFLLNIFYFVCRHEREADSKRTQWPIKLHLSINKWLFVLKAFIFIVDISDICVLQCNRSLERKQLNEGRLKIAFRREF